MQRWLDECLLMPCPVSVAPASVRRGLALQSSALPPCSSQLRCTLLCLLLHLRHPCALRLASLEHSLLALHSQLLLQGLQRDMGACDL